MISSEQCVKQKFSEYVFSLLLGEGTGRKEMGNICVHNPSLLPQSQ